MNPQDAHFNPFPGLRPFQIEEKYLFFGREEQTSELLTRLRKTRFLAVVGVSGSGKSSLVRAGLLPELHGGTMATAGSSWEVAVMRPGGDPLANLAEALIEADIHDSGEEHINSHVRASLARSGMGLVEAVKQGDLPENTNLLVVVDQFEEIFRFRRMSGLSEEEAGHFITLLLEASEQIDLPIYIVITMRSDFLGDCAQFRGLAEAVNEGEYLIPRLNRNQRRQAIEGPVAVGQRQITSRLVQRLLNDIGDDPDQLPILQHALMRTWDHWDESGADGPLDLDHYQATGGMDEALSRHADEVHAELPDDEHRWISQKLFKALTEKVDQHRGIRRPMQFHELCQIIEKENNKIRTVVDAFRRQGRTFLMPSGDSEIIPKTVIDISHESLMRVWLRLRDWVDDEAQSAKIYRRLADTSSLYQDGKAGFYRDPDLQIALSWREETQPNKTWADHYFAGFDEAMSFLDKSQEEAEREEREREEARQRELAQAQALAKAQEERAEAEQLRAEEQARSASRLRKMLAGLAAATCAAVVFLVIAVIAKQATEEAKLQVDNKILELAERSIATGDSLSAEGETLRALPWYADAADLAKGDPNLQLAYERNLSEKIEKAPSLKEIVFSDHNIFRAGFTDDGKYYFIGEQSGWNSPSELLLFKTSTNKLVYKHTLPAGINGIDISSDGKLLIVPNGQSNVSVLDIPTGKLLHNFDKHTGWVRNQISMTRDNLLLAVPLGGLTNGVAIWDNKTGEEKYSILSTDEVCHAVSFSSDNRFLAAGTGGNGWGNGDSGAVYVWELASNEKPQLKYRIEIGQPVQSISFANQGYSFAFACGSLIGEIGPFYGRVLDAEDGQAISKKMEHDSAVVKVEYSPDGRWLLTASIDGTARNWDATTGNPISAPMTHSSQLNDATFSPDGAFIATASTDNTARVWDAVTGKPLTPPLRHMDQVNSVSFDPTCRSVITSSRDQTARIYLLPMERKILTGKATQSSTEFGGSAARAIDGNKDGRYGMNSTTHTSEKDTKPWWQIDFKEQQMISEIVLWNRQNFQQRLVNFRVRLMIGSDLEVWSRDFLTGPKAVAPNPNLIINLTDPILASKLRIEKIGPNAGGEYTLSLAEVEIFAATESGMESKNINNLQNLSHVNSASKINANGRLVELPKNELKTTWESLKSFNSVEPSLQETSDWHRLRTRQLYSAKHWSGFFYHYSRMNLKEQEESDYVKMEAIAYAELGLWEKSFQLHRKAMQFTPTDTEIVSGYLSLCVQLGRFNEGQKIVQGIIESFSDGNINSDELAYLAITYPNLFEDISIPLTWVDAQYKQRPGYIDLGNSEAINLKNAITIEGWFFHNSTGGLVSKGGAFDDDGYGITIGFQSGDFRFELQNTMAKEKMMADSSLPKNRAWRHLAATWDKKSREAILYINGVRQQRTVFFNGPIGVTNQRLNLGRNERVGNRYCNAGFSDFRIWNRVRTAEEIMQTMNSRLLGNEPGLVGYWPFDQDTGDIARSGLAEGVSGKIVNPNWRTTNELPFSDQTTYCEVSRGELNLWRVLTLKGGLLYRNGRPKQAVETLESARIGGARRPVNKRNQDDGNQLQWLLLAQCYNQIGEKEKATSLFMLANKRATDSFLRDRNWRERLRLKSLLKETSVMLGQGQGGTN